MESVNFHLGENGSGADNPAIVAYRSSGGCTFGSLTEVGSDIPGLGTDANSDFSINCLQGNTTYFIQCGYNDRTLDAGSAGVFDLDINATSATTGPDNICSAVSMGTLNGTAAALSISNQSNICASAPQANEPGGGQKTVWYTFTTGATVGSNLNVNMDAIGNGLNADVYLYRACGTVCSGSTLNAGVLQEIGNWYDVNPLGSEFDAGGSVQGVILPNTTYYIRADGVPTVGEDGQFNLSVSFSGGAPLSNDHYCGASSMGTGFNYNTAQLSVSSNTDNASSEDVCSTNEPDNSNEKSLWYKFTTGVNPPAIITLNPSASGLCTGQAWVYSGAASGACTGNAFSNYNSGTNFNGLTRIDYTELGNDFTINCPAANTTYYVQVQVGGVCNSGAISLTVTSNGAPKPSNDLCANAISLGTLAQGGTIGDAAGTNRWNNFCSNGTGDPSPGWTFDGTTRQAVWFTFNTGTTGAGSDITIEAYNDPANLGDQIDLKLALYEGSCGSLTYIDRDYNVPLFGETMEDKYCLKPNTNYYVLVDGSGINTQGFFGLTVKDNGPYPGNDKICGVNAVTTYDIGTSAGIATKVGTVNSDSKSGTTVKGTNCFDPLQNWSGGCNLAFSDDNDYGVWYKLPSATKRKDVVLKGASLSNDMDIKFALYNQPTANALSQCNGRLGGADAMSLVSGSYYGALGWDAAIQGTCASPDEDHIYTCLDPTQTYYLLVDAGEGLCGTGDFTINAYYPLEGGSTPCTAEWLPGVTTSTWSAGIHKIDLAANFCGATYAGIPTAPWTYEKPVWWKFVAPASGTVELRIKSDSTNLGDELRPKIWVFEENTAGSCSNTLLNYTNLDQKDPDDLLSVGDPDLLTEILDVRCLVPGRTYYVVTDGVTTIAEICGVGTKVGFYSLEIKDLGQTKRKNDTICGATPGRVAGDPYYFIPTAAWKTVNKEVELTKNNQDNYCFVIENEPSASSYGGTWSTINNVRGGWYSFTAPPSGKVEIEFNNISVTSDQVDAQVAVYRIKTGKTCNDVQTTSNINNPTLSPLEFYGSSNDAYAGILADEDLTVSCLMPDSLYYIYIEGINSNTLGITDLGTGDFNLTIRSYPQDPPAANDNKCNPIYLGQPTNTIGSTTGIINATSTNFNRTSSTLAGAPTLGTNGVTLVKARGNHGGVLPVSAPPGGNEVALSCSPNPGCIDGIGSDYDRSVYPFNNFCATAVGDSTPANWGAIFGAVDGKPRKSVWFMFKAPADLDNNGEEAVEIALNQELISLNAHKDGMDLRGAVFESSDNTCNGYFFDIKSEYDIGDFDETFKVTCLEPNRFYWLMVDGSPINDEGYFGLKISRVTPDPRPANDYICSAYTLSNSFFSGAAVGRTKDTNICARITRTSVDPTPENDPTGFDLDHTVWYKFTTPSAPGDYAVKVDVNGWGPGLFGYSDKMDPQIAIFESQNGTCNWGTDGTNMVEIASEYDVFPFAESMIGYCLQPSKTYYVMVDGSGLNSQGFFDITIDDYSPITPFPSAVANYDLFANAVSLSMPVTAGAGGKTTSALAHNYCSGIETDEPDSWTLYDIDNTVWWKFTVPTTGIYSGQHVDMTLRLKSDPGGTKNDGINLLGAVYELNGTANFSNLTNIATGTNILIYDEDITLTCLKPGSTYYLQVDGYSGPFNIFRAQGQGYYKVELEVATLTPNQGNDSICGAITVPVHPTNYYPTSGSPYNNICKTVQAKENLPWLNADDKTVWFKFQPPATGNVTIDVQSQGADDIGAQVAIYQSQIPIASSACQTVDSLVLVEQDYDPLAAGETVTAKCLNTSVWHYIQVNSDIVSIWGQGTFKINVKDIGGTTTPPYNDNICNAYDFGNVTNATGTAKQRLSDSNRCASIQVNEPNTTTGCSCIQKSVWYKFTAPISGRVKVTVHDVDGFLSGIDPEVYLYSGTLTGCPSATPAFTGFTQLEGAYNPLPNFPSSTTGDEVIEYECLTPGQLYYIQVDGTTVGGPQGFFDITIEDLIPNYASSPKKPANDEPANAVTLTVQDEQCAVPIGVTSEGDELQGSGSWSTENYKKPTITKKDVTGTCNTSDNCGDIWYKFTMPSEDCMLGSVVTIQGYSDQVAIGSAYHNDLKILAYRGTIGSLVPVECGNTDDNALTVDYFHYEITGTAGETIYLQVFDQNNNDTDNDDEEDFFICVSRRYGVDKCQNLNSLPFMDFGKDYCWNVEGASGETPASAYGETNSSTNPTENSAYLKFKMTPSPCDSIKITIKQPTPPNLFLQDGTFNTNQIVSLSVYREDNALCDGTIDGALVSKSYVCSGPAAIFDNTITYTVGVSNLDTNKVYVVQIDGQGQDVTGYINNGTIRVDTFQRCVNVQAVTFNDTSVSYFTCPDGWRYYHDRNKIIIFALYPNGNVFDGVAKINYKSTFDSAVSCPSLMAEYSMRRIWDFSISSGSINPLAPVKVRFYYRSLEKQAIIDEANAFLTRCGGFFEPFEWFKTASGIQYIPSTPAQINPQRITAGYSQTSCLGSDLFGSPNGCNTLTASDNQISCNGTLYVELGAITGFSGGSGAVGVGPWQNTSPLPVELTSFTGYNEGAKNVLNWTTASERNTLKFMVERSGDGISFDPIGEKAAAGYSAYPLDYTMDDSYPLDGANYYRLKIIDRDNTFEYSQTILIRTAGAIVYQNTILNIFPNPTHHAVFIEYLASAKGTVALKVFNALGQSMLSKKTDVEKGKQLIWIDVSSFSDGMYVIQLQDESTGEILQSKFMKE
ncbi:MAG: T9SS type A sorting domain-containing protein [Sphingobacteriales bacterium]|nr:T9SS type A sorting domain-containing protein [Sphingobacteriales bacterium]